MANYYDIYHILTDEEFVPVVFHKAANEVIIDPSSETNSVEQGANVKLHLWLAQELHWRTRLEIQADAACVDLRSRCSYFYEFGCKILPLVGDKTIEVLLLSAFKIKYKEILTKAYTAAYTAISRVLTLLRREETKFYEAAQSSMSALKKWRMGGPGLQRASVLGRKRKSID